MMFLADCNNSLKVSKSFTGASRCKIGNTHSRRLSKGWSVALFCVATVSFVYLGWFCFYFSPSSALPLDYKLFESRNLNHVHLAHCSPTGAVQNVYLFCLGSDIREQGPNRSSQLLSLLCVVTFFLLLFKSILFSFISFKDNASNWFANPPMGCNSELKKLKN